jgi:membrane fusion protein, multidrug efflux system
MQLDRKTIRRRRNLILSLVGIALAAGIFAYAAKWGTSRRFWVTTDNAFVTGNLIPVYADATGIVAQVYYEETEYVSRGDLLIRLDAQRAAAALGQVQGELARAVRAVGALFAVRQQACQKVLAQAALLDKIRHDIVRYRQALPSGSVSKQVLQNAEDQRASLEADTRAARADFQSTQARVGGTTRIRHPDIERSPETNSSMPISNLRGSRSGHRFQAMSPSVRRKSEIASAQVIK